MSRKVIITIILICLSLCAWILYDRHKNIRVVSNYQGKFALEVYESFWVEPLKGRWLNLEDECNTNFANIYVEDFNPILRTWEKGYSMDTTWYYYDEAGQPLILRVSESDIYFTPDFTPTIDYEYYGEIDGIKVYYKIIDSKIYTMMESKTKTIKFEISIYDQDRLEGFMKKAIDVLK